MNDLNSEQQSDNLIDEIPELYFCPHCHGSGTTDENDAYACSYCDGAGFVEFYCLENYDRWLDQEN